MGTVTLKGESLTVEGNEVKVGDQAPAFKVSKEWNQFVESSEFDGKPRIINVVPSLDTGVCDSQTKRFAEEAAKVSGAEWISISADQPPTQTRWRGAAQVTNLTMLSDAALREFGYAYGLWVKELSVLQRCLIVIDADNKISYIERVEEIATAPDFDAALEALRKVVV